MPGGDDGLSQVHRAHICAALMEESHRPMLVLCTDDVEVKRIAGDLKNFTGYDPVLLAQREFQFHAATLASKSRRNGSRHCIKLLWSIRS